MGKQVRNSNFSYQKKNPQNVHFFQIEIVVNNFWIRHFIQTSHQKKKWGWGDEIKSHISRNSEIENQKQFQDEQHRTCIALATKITELFDWFIFYTLDKTNNQLWLFFTDVIIIDDVYL